MRIPNTKFSHPPHEKRIRRLEKPWLVTKEDVTADESDLRCEQRQPSMYPNAIAVYVRNRVIWAWLFLEIDSLWNPERKALLSTRLIVVTRSIYSASIAGSSRSTFLDHTLMEWASMQDALTQERLKKWISHSSTGKIGSDTIRMVKLMDIRTSNEISPNKRMPSDQNARYAFILTTDARRYKSYWFL